MTTTESPDGPGHLRSIALTQREIDVIRTELADTLETCEQYATRNPWRRSPFTERRMEVLRGILDKLK